MWERGPIPHQPTTGRNSDSVIELLSLSSHQCRKHPDPNPLDRQNAGVLPGIRSEVDLGDRSSPERNVVVPDPLALGAVGCDTLQDGSTTLAERPDGPSTRSNT